jgi:hypothetical protein
LSGTHIRHVPLPQRSDQRVAIVPRHATLRARGKDLGVLLQLGRVVQRVHLVQLARVDQAYVQIANRLPGFRLFVPSPFTTSPFAVAGFRLFIPSPFAVDFRDYSFRTLSGRVDPEPVGRSRAPAGHQFCCRGSTPRGRCPHSTEVHSMATTCFLAYASG